MFLFAGHDPGSVNHTRPIFKLALSDGRDAIFEELRPDPKLGVVWGGRTSAVEVLDRAQAAAAAKGHAKVSACVCGLSTNKAELALMEVCRERGIPTALVIDFAPGHRLTDAPPATAFPDLFLMTNPLAVAEVCTKYGVEARRVRVAGSAYLEQLAEDGSAARLPPEAVRAAYGLPASAALVPFFLAPDDMVPAAGAAIPAAVEAVRGAVAAALPGAAVVARPHPRNAPATLAALQAAPAPGPRAAPLVLDTAALVDNKSLSRACSHTLSMGSTVSMESAAWGTPSAFFQVAWDPSKIEAIMHCLPAPRVTSGEHLAAFLAGPSSPGWKRCFPSVPGVGEDGSFNVEHCRGATQRSWALVRELAAQGGPAEGWRRWAGIALAVVAGVAGWAGRHSMRARRGAGPN